MKNIFDKKYRYGTETFLTMYLNKFQFILGSDLESYAQSDEIFVKDYPCNIYFVVRRPKVSFSPESVEINGNKAGFDLIIHHREEGGAVRMGLELKKAKSELQFHSEYPHDFFVFGDNERVLFGARPGTLIDCNQLENNIDLPILDYEVLYIGQAYGKDGKKTALDRLASHSTLQKIYSHALVQNPDYDIWILLTHFEQISEMFALSSDQIIDKGKYTKLQTEKEKHYFNNNGLAITEKQKIAFTEAALINYFEPKYNIDFKNNFPSINHKSYSECYKLDIKALTIEIDTSESIRKIFTNKTGRVDRHLKMFEFNSDKDRFSLLDIIK